MKEIIETLSNIASGTLDNYTAIELKSFFGVAVGGLLQFMFGKGNSIRVLLLISLSSIFMSVFILQPMMSYMGIPEESSLRVILYSLSALISVELINILIMVLPKAARNTILTKLGVPQSKIKGE